MKNLLAFIGGAVVVFFGVGLYLGWYHIYRTPTSEPGHSRIEIDINKDKIGKDVKQGTDKLKDAIDRATTNPNDGTDPKGPATTPTNPTGTDLKKKANDELLKNLADGWYAPPKK